MFTRFESEVVDRATSSMSCNRLIEIVQTTESFVFDSRELLVAALTSSQRLDPNTKGYLPMALEKIARYSSASRYLVDTVRKRKYTIFSNIKVEVFGIPVPTEPLFQGPLLSLEEAWKNVSNGRTSVRTRRANLNVVSFLTNSYQAKAAEFQDRISAADQTCKIHAEIQLLMYHELNPEQPKPRVIASSKDACYLCDLFIGLHGQFRVPRTHGRIYDRWLLPDWVEISEQPRTRMALAREQLNTSIEKTIIATLRSRRTSHNHPNESTLFTVDPCSSSTVNAFQLLTPMATPMTSRLALGSRKTEADTTLENVGDPLYTSKSSLLKVKPSDGLLPAKSPTSLRTVSSPVAAEKPQPHLSSSESEQTSISMIPARKSPTNLNNNLGSRSGEGPGQETRDNHNSSDLKATSQTSSFPGLILANPGEECSYILNSGDDEAHVQAANLRLTLSREILRLPNTPGSQTCTINVRMLDEKEHCAVHRSIQRQEIVNAHDVAKGGAITVERGGWLSEYDLLIYSRPDTLVSIRCFQ